MVHTNNGDYMYFLNYFFVSSILGFLFESFFYITFNWEGNSGYLFGPWTPVYGIGSVIIIFIYNFLNKKIKNKLVKFITFFLSISIILSIIEFIGGTLIENIFHEVFWDYSDHLLNIGKYVSIEMGLIWGIISTLFIYLIKPFLDKYIVYIPKGLSYILVILFIIDNIATMFLKLKLI